MTPAQREAVDAVEKHGSVRAAARALQSLTFHKQDGLVLRALDPIERVA